MFLNESKHSISIIFYDTLNDRRTKVLLTAEQGKNVSGKMWEHDYNHYNMFSPHETLQRQQRQQRQHHLSLASVDRTKNTLPVFFSSIRPKNILPFSVMFSDSMSQLLKIAEACFISPGLRTVLVFHLALSSAQWQYVRQKEDTHWKKEIYG